MTDYNDGNWHEWTGGPCPVHPKSKIEGYWQVEDASTNQMSKPAVYNTGRAYGLIFEWDGQTRLHLFRVVEKFEEPKVIWVNEYENAFVAYPTKERAKEESVSGNALRVAVKYVESRDD